MGEVAHFLASVPEALFSCASPTPRQGTEPACELKFFLLQSQCPSISPETQMSYKYHGVHSAACLSKGRSVLAVWPGLSPQ